MTRVFRVKDWRMPDASELTPDQAKSRLVSIQTDGGNQLWLVEATKAEVQAHVRGLVEAREEAKAALDRIVAKPKNDDETDP
jgi:hypothetical protein